VPTWYLTAVQSVDIDPILEIEQHSFRIPWSRASFLAELSAADTLNFVVKHRNENLDEHIVAYVFFRLTANELHLLRLAVSPEWRGQGIATWLLGKCLNWGLKRGAASVFLEVRPSNSPALALYQKFGFEVIGKRSNYYPETREDALVMMKNLKEAA